MNENNNPNFPQDADWSNGFLTPPDFSQELGADSQELDALSQSQDAQLEDILEQAKGSSWSSDENLASQLSEDDQLFSQDAFQIPQAFDSASAPRSSFSPMRSAFSQEAESFTPEDISEAGQYFQASEMESIQEYPLSQAFAPMEEAGQSAADVVQPPVDEAPTDAEPTEESPVKKRRPQRKKGYGLLGLPHIVSTFIWLGIIVAIGVTLGRLVWVAAADMLAFDKPYVSAVITIAEEDSLDDIVKDLEEAGLVRYPVLFKAFAGIKGGREEFSNGTFTFSDETLYDYNAVMNNLNPHSSAREVVEDLVIPEGYTCAQIFALLEEKGVCSAKDMEEYCANGQLKDYWFLEGVERGDRYCLEGYLFPDTYDFYKDDAPVNVITKMLNAFDDRYTDVMKEKLEPLNKRLASTLASRGFSQEYINQHEITIREVVIIASMIERESTDGAERFKVSGVIYNRLTNPAQFPKLQIDATIIYALGGNIDPETGKVKPLTKADLAMDHPYNSYVYSGLIPGPISNPGTASLNAALEPNDEGYYFYVFDPDAGEHIFSKTLAEHEKAVASVGN